VAETVDLGSWSAPRRAGASANPQVALPFIPA